MLTKLHDSVSVVEDSSHTLRDLKSNDARAEKPVAEETMQQ